MNAAVEKRRLRVGMLTLVLAGLFSLIVIRIAVLLALDGTRLSSLARGEHSEQVTLTAPRGPIVDHHGEALALSAQSRIRFTRGRRGCSARAARRIGRRLARALKLSPAELAAKLGRPARLCLARAAH